MGIKDLFRFKRAFIFHFFLNYLSGIMIIAATMSYLEELNDLGYADQGYEIVPIEIVSQDEDTRGISNQLKDVFSQGGLIIFLQSGYFEGIFHRKMDAILYHDGDVQIVLKMYQDDGSALRNNWKEQYGAFREVSADWLQNRLKSLGYHQRYWADMLDQDPFVYIQYDMSKLSDLADVFPKGSDLVDLADVYFNKSELQKGLDRQFENAFLNTPYVAKKSGYRSGIGEFGFLSFYILPYIFLLVLAIALSFVIFMRNQYRVMRKEYAIHLVCGAEKKMIFVRNGVFNMALMGMHFIAMNLLNRWTMGIGFIIISIQTISVFFVLEVIIWQLLKKEDFISSLRRM